MSNNINKPPDPEHTITADNSKSMEVDVAHFGEKGVIVVGSDGMDLAAALATSSQQKQCQYIFFHNHNATMPGPDTNACFELFKQLISKGERCIYMDTSLTQLPSHIPIGDRIAKYEVLDLAKQMQISDKMIEPKKPAIDLFSGPPFKLLIPSENVAQTNMPPAPISVDIYNMMAQTRQLFEMNEQILDNLNSEVQQFRYCLSDEMCMNLSKLFEDILKQKAQMNETWCRALHQQMGSIDTSKNDPQPQIADMHKKIKQLSHCDLFVSVHKKCQTAAFLKGLGVPYVGRGTMDLAAALATSSQQKKCQYVFFHNAALPPDEPGTNACFELFTKLIFKDERCIYMDTSLTQLPPDIPTGDRIAKYFITNLTSTDLFMDIARKLKACIVRMEGPVFDEAVNANTPKDEQFELEIPCPKASRYSGKCSNDKCRWECDDCGQFLQLVIHKPTDVS